MCITQLQHSLSVQGVMAVILMFAGHLVKSEGKVKTAGYPNPTTPPRRKTDMLRVTGPRPKHRNISQSSRGKKRERQIHIFLII